MSNKINFIASQTFNKVIIQLVSHLFNVILIFSVFASISTNPESINIYLNSDTFYLPSIYRDVFIDGNGYIGWHFNPAPNFIPDMLVYFVLMAVVKNFILASAFYSVFQYLFIVGLMNRIFKCMFPNFSHFILLLISLLLSLFLLETLLFSHDFSFTFYILSNAYHTGSFVVLLCCLYLTMQYIKKPQPIILILLFLLEVLGILSDRLLSAILVPSMIFACVLQIKSIGIKKANRLISVLIFSTTLAYWLYYKIADCGDVQIDSALSLHYFDRVTNSFIVYFHHIAYMLQKKEIKSVIIYLFSLTFIWQLVLLAKYYFDFTLLQRFYLLFSIFYSLMGIIAPLINGSYTSYDHLRYNIYPFYLIALNTPVIIAIVVKNESIKKAGKALLLSSLLFLGIFAGSNINKPSMKAFFDYYPNTTRKLDSLNQKYRLLCGVSTNYWESKKHYMLSVSGIKLFTVFSDLVVYDHVANENWYYGSNLFNFAVLNKAADTVYLPQQIKPYQIINNEQGLFVIKTQLFGYKKGSGFSPVTMTDKWH